MNTGMQCNVAEDAFLCMQEAAALGHMPSPASGSNTALEQRFGIQSNPAPDGSAPGQPQMPRVPSLAPLNSGEHSLSHALCSGVILMDSHTIGTAAGLEEKCKQLKTFPPSAAAHWM